jgi:hypothetical protein
MVAREGTPMRNDDMLPASGCWSVMGVLHLGIAYRLEGESFEAHDNNQLPRYIPLILWQRLPLRDTTLEFHRDSQDKSCYTSPG